MVSRHSFASAAGLVLVTTFAAAQVPPPQTAQPAQDPPPVVFKVEINYVEVDARVLDREGNFVRGLRQEDFEVIEGGKPQVVSAFGLVDIPIVAPEKPRFASAPVEADVTSNVQSLNGRIYLILLDDYHVSPAATGRVKDLARRFVLEKVDANDQAAVILTSGRPAGSQMFTRNRTVLLRAIDQFVGQKLPSPALNRANASPTTRAEFGNSSSFLDADEAQRSHQARSALDSLRGLAEWMSAIRGRRKAIIYVSEGIDYDLNEAFITPNDAGQAGSARDGTLLLGNARDAIAAATRNNVSIYTVDPRGISPGGSIDAELVNQSGGSRAMGADPFSFERVLAASQSGLRQLAEETGGFAAVGTNDLAGAFDRIVQENSSYYVLGYYPADERRDGRIRSIEVRVRGRDDLRVIHRRGYAAPRGNQPPARTPAAPGDRNSVAAQLTDALTSPLPLSGLTMRVAATPMKGEGRNADVVVLIEAVRGDLTFTESGGTFTNDLSLIVAAFDKAGKMVAGDRPEVNLKLRPETHARVASSGLRLVRKLSLPPGQYQLRVAAHESVGLRQGTVHLDLDVPDFSRGPITISGLALASATGDQTVAMGADPFAGGLPAPPTAVREFPSGDQLAAFVEVYDNQPRQPHRVDIATTVRAEDGRVVFTNKDERSSDELQGARGGYGYTTRIDLDRWEPGIYVLTIEARSRLGNADPVTRELQFRVR